MEWRMRGRATREGKYVDLLLIHVVWQEPTQHCKPIILQLKNKLKKKDSEFESQTVDSGFSLSFGWV